MRLLGDVRFDELPRLVRVALRDAHRRRLHGVDPRLSVLNAESKDVSNVLESCGGVHERHQSAVARRAGRLAQRPRLRGGRVLRRPELRDRRNRGLSSASGRSGSRPSSRPPRDLGSPSASRPSGAAAPVLLAADRFEHPSGGHRIVLRSRLENRERGVVVFGPAAELLHPVECAARIGSRHRRLPRLAAMRCARRPACGRRRKRRACGRRCAYCAATCVMTSGGVRSTFASSHSVASAGSRAAQFATAI